MENDIATKVLEKEERFMLGNSLDGLAILSHLTFKKLIKISPRTEEENEASSRYSYFLKTGGSVSLDYNKYNETMQVIIHEGISEKVAEELKQIGKESRERANMKKYGVKGVF